jgi:hypothetical protein
LVSGSCPDLVSGALGAARAAVGKRKKEKKGNMKQKKKSSGRQMIDKAAVLMTCAIATQYLADGLVAADEWAGADPQPTNKPAKVAVQTGAR